MRRTLVRNAFSFISSPKIPLHSTQILIPNLISPYFFSSNPNPNNPAVEDVSTQELKSRIAKYFAGDDDALTSVMEAILARKMTGLHEDTDDELAEQIKSTPLEHVDESDMESDFEKAKPDDETTQDLYNAKEAIVLKKMLNDENFNMDDAKLNAMIEANQKGKPGVSMGYEEILEDMLRWDKVLPEDIRQKLQEKRDELTKRVENQEIEEKEGNELFQTFEDEIIAEYAKKGEGEKSIESDELVEPDNKSDDPPGVGPILRWQTRLVLTHGGDAWHPKNRKVKLSVTVKELGLSKYQFRRMREIVGKRYDCGKDELTITSERFDHREENKKDCLKTLVNIIEEAGKADALVDEARTAYVKERLKANPEFMARLHTKTTQAPDAVPA